MDNLETIYDQLKKTCENMLSTNSDARMLHLNLPYLFQRYTWQFFCGSLYTYCMPPKSPKQSAWKQVINDFGRWFLLNASSTLNSSALSFFTSFPKFHESRLDAVKHHVVRDHNALGPLATEELVVARLGPCQLPCIWNHKVTASYSIKEMGT